MSEEIMPAVEVEDEAMDAKERQSYELAFHILPTIAEEEVLEVFEAIKAMVVKKGGEVTGEEAPERFDLAYEVEKHLEGKNRKFKTAYFGWVRLEAVPESAVAIAKDMDWNNSVMRHLLIKLTRVEEENPFRFHDAIRDQKMVTTVEDGEVVLDSEEAAVVAEKDEEVDEVALDKALEEKEV
ncbi:hypothetical protein A2837_03490 [Candidatus Kaiserbacteria bacterium RIFCSPHIGHO2_01_FULL_46_22]|uniref:Small ribosomal subunit protein bS6 n=1 Tax=Candidatus Kaiserbacteria bacterium RIFCSPHIGHO2_01_FULL_46_22 TaxID=1798475 RepID=A0A1F6BYG2_9BACT|nr:MAG: hypothetical protein A2837_03490 [Candidatus Kaiserbacteria bacterium RIFCSPHIGHO2_01_FULL_46_22]